MQTRASMRCIIHALFCTAASWRVLTFNTRTMTRQRLPACVTRLRLKQLVLRWTLLHAPLIMYCYYCAREVSTHCMLAAAEPAPVHFSHRRFFVAQLKPHRIQPNAKTNAMISCIPARMGEVLAAHACQKAKKAMLVAFAFGPCIMGKTCIC